MLPHGLTIRIARDPLALGMPPTFEDIFYRHPLQQPHVKEGLDTYVSTLEKENQDLVDEARYLSNINSVLRVARDSMRARVVSRISSYRRRGVPNYAKVEDNDSERRKNGRHFHERGGQFSPCIATSPQTDPHSQNNSRPTSEVSHILSSQTENTIMPAARCAELIQSYEPWRLEFLSDNTLRPFQRPLLQLM